MFECELPFDHKTLHLELEDKNFAGVMEGHQNEFKTTKSQEELVEESLANPYGSPSLEELCAGKKDIDRKSTRLNSSHIEESRMPSSA